MKIVKRYGFKSELKRRLKNSQKPADGLIKKPDRKKNNGMWNE